MCVAMQNDDKLFDLASKRLGLKRDELEKGVSQNGQNILSRLSDSDKQKVSEILEDPNKTREILSSPKAQELMKKFFGEK